MIALTALSILGIGGWLGWREAGIWIKALEEAYDG